MHQVYIPFERNVFCKFLYACGLIQTILCIGVKNTHIFANTIYKLMQY